MSLLMSLPALVICEDCGVCTSQVSSLNTSQEVTDLAQTHSNSLYLYINHHF